MIGSIAEARDAGPVSQVAEPGDFFTCRAGDVPFVFVNADAGAPPLAEFLGELPALVEASGFDLGAVSFRRRDEFENAANWKVVVENYQHFQRLVCDSLTGGDVR